MKISRLIKTEEEYNAALFRIEKLMEQMNLTVSDLAPLMGGKSHASEVLSGKRPLSLSMIRNLSKALHIPAEILIQEIPVKKESA